MKFLKTEIVIAASPDRIWQVLMDFEKYPEWNPFLISVEGEPVVGKKLKNTIKLAEKKQMQFEPEVLVVEACREFRWVGKTLLKGVFDGEHYFELKPGPEEGTTTLHHGERFTGWFSGIIFSMIRKETLAGFNAMNEALKKRVEAKA